MRLQDSRHGCQARDPRWGDLSESLTPSQRSSTEVVIEQAGAHDLVAEDAVDGKTALGDGVGHGREGRRELDGAQGVLVQDGHAGGLPQQDELQLSALGDPELDQELALDATVARLARIDPAALDLLADLVQVVLGPRLGRVERDGLALDAAPPSLEPSTAAGSAEHAGRR